MIFYFYKWCDRLSFLLINKPQIVQQLYVNTYKFSVFDII